jgi:hypothetical protein
MAKRRKGNWGVLPETDPIFSGGVHFGFYEAPTEEPKVSPERRVVQERRARSTGTVVQVIDRGYLWSDRWETRCVDHDFARSNPTRAGATSFASCPEHWCDQCHENTGSRFRYATDEDVERLGIVIGVPVRPEPTPTPADEEATILVGGMTREEFLGEPERIDFPQPKRSIRGLSHARLTSDRLRSPAPPAGGRSAIPVSMRDHRTCGGRMVSPHVQGSRAGEGTPA